MATPTPDYDVPARYRSKPAATPQGDAAIVVPERYQSKPTEATPEAIDMSVPARYRSKSVPASAPAVEENPFTIFATPQVPAGFPARDEPVSPEEQRKARDKAIRSVTQDIYGMNPYESVIREENIQREIDNSAYTPSAKPSPITPWVNPSAYVPQTEYESVIDTPEYSKLRAVDAANAKSLAAQGAGYLDPLRPRTLDSDYAAKVREYKAGKKSIADALLAIVNEAPQYSPEQKAEATEFYKNNFPWAPEIGAYFQAGLQGNLKAEDVPTVMQSLEPMFERVNPEHSILPDTVAMTEGIPVVGTGARLLSENITQPLFGFKEGSQGELVEPTALTGLRVLNSPTGAVAGAIEGIASTGADIFTRGPVQALADAPQTISGAAGRYIREGRGFTDASSQVLGRIGANIDQAVGYIAGYTPEQAKIYGEAQPFLASTGLVAGLALDLYLGPDEIVRAPLKLLEVGQMARLADIAINAPKVSEAALDASRTVGRPALDRIAVEGTEALKQFKPTELIRDAVDPHEAAVSRFIRDNEKLAEVIIETSKEPAGASVMQRLKSGISKVDGRAVADITDQEAEQVASALDRAGFLGKEATRMADGTTISSMQRLHRIVGDSELSNGLLGQLYALKDEAVRVSKNPDIVAAELERDLGPVVQETQKVLITDLMQNDYDAQLSAHLKEYIDAARAVTSIDDVKNLPKLRPEVVDELVKMGVDIPTGSVDGVEATRVRNAVAAGESILPDRISETVTKLRELEATIQREFKQQGLKVPGELVSTKRSLKETLDNLMHMDALTSIDGVEVIGKAEGKRLLNEIASKEVSKFSKFANALEDIRDAIPGPTSPISTYTTRAKGLFPQARQDLARVLSQKVAQRNYLTAIRSGIRKALPNRAVLSSSTDILSRDIVRISPDTYVTKAAARNITRDFLNSAVSKLHSGRNSNFSEALKELQEVRYPKLNSIDLKNLSAKEYQDIVDFMYKDAARKQKFWLSTEDVARAVEDLSQASSTTRLRMPTVEDVKNLPATVRGAGQAAVNKLKSTTALTGSDVVASTKGTALTFRNELKATQLRQRLFSPKELEASFLANSLWGVIKLAKGGDKSIANPVVEAFVTEVKNSWGSIWDKFKMDQRAARRSGLSWEDATTKVAVGDNPALYFDEFLKTAYGGVNRVEASLEGRGTSIRTSSELASPEDISLMVDTLVSTHPDVIRAKSAFTTAIAEGKYTEALEKLHAVMGALQGRTFGSLFDPAVVSEAIKAEPKLRQAFKLLAGESLAIHLDNFLKVVPATYQQMRQAEALRDITSKFADKYPSTLSLSGSLADQWYTSYKSELASLARHPDDAQLLNNLMDAISKFPKLRTALSNEDIGIILTSKLLKGPASTLGPESLVRSNALAQIFSTVFPSKMTFAAAKAMTVDDMVRVLEKYEAGLLMDIKNKASTLGKVGDEAANAQYKTIHLHADPDLQDIITNILDEKLAFRSPFLNSFVESRIGELPFWAKEEGAENIRAVISASAKFRDSGTPIDEVSRLKQYYLGGATEKQLLAASNVEKLSETLEAILIPKGSRVVSEAEAIAVQEVLDMKLADIVAHARAVNAPVPTGVSALWKAWDAGKNMTRQGILAGQWWTLGNPIFHAKNILEAVLNVLNTVGPKAALNAAAGGIDVVTGGKLFKFATLDNTTSRIFKAIFNPDAEGAVFDEVIHTASGRNYTVRELVEAISAGSVMKSQAGAELSQDIFEDFAHYVAREHGSMKKVGDVKTLFNQTTGGVLGTKQNIFSRFADATDTMFRVSVFTGAIKEGRSIEEATRLAREALFDYGSVSKLEKGTIARIVWFYTFWSRNLISNVKNVLSHPGRLTAPLTAKSALEKDQEANYAPDYAQLNLFRTLTEDRETKARFQTMGIGVPQFQATSDLMDYIGILGAYGGAGRYLTQGELRRAIDLGGRASFDLFTNITGKASPLPKLITGGATGYDLQRGGKALPYVDAKLAWWLHQRPEMWAAFKSIVPLVQVTDADKLDPEYETYMGSQWKVKPGYENRWYAIQQVLIPMGIARAVKNYPDAIEALPSEVIETMPESIRPRTSGLFLDEKGKSPGGELVDNKFIYPSRLDALMYATGVQVKRNTPTLEELRIQVEKDKLQRIKSR